MSSKKFHDRVDDSYRKRFVAQSQAMRPNRIRFTLPFLAVLAGCADSTRLAESEIDLSDVSAGDLTPSEVTDAAGNPVATSDSEVSPVNLSDSDLDSVPDLETDLETDPKDSEVGPDAPSKDLTTDTHDADSAPGLDLRGRILFERRAPDPTRAFLDVPTLEPLANHRVELYAGPDLVALGPITTDADGTFSAPRPDATSVTLVVTAALGPPETSPIVVFDGLTASLPNARYTPIPGPRPWAWTFTRDMGTGDLGTLTIPASAGSGALALLDTLARVRASALALFPPTTPPTLGILWSPSRAWACLSCYLPSDFGPVVWSTPSGPVAYDRAMFVSGTAATPHHWVPGILAHELGHWVADAFSRLPETGGPHAWDERVRPELAFSEGFATFFSLWAQLPRPDDPAPPEAPARFFSVQQNVSYWIDFERLGDISPTVDLDFPRPSPEAGLDQPMNEAVIAAALWDLLDDAPHTLAPARGDDDPCALGDIALTAAGLSRFTDPSIDRGPAGPDLVDYLDALACTDTLPDAACLDVALLGFPYDAIPACPLP
jgi:hypothetical protein